MILTCKACFINLRLPCFVCPWLQFLWKIKNNSYTINDRPINKIMYKIKQHRRAEVGCQYHPKIRKLEGLLFLFSPSQDFFTPPGEYICTPLLINHRIFHKKSFTISIKVTFPLSRIDRRSQTLKSSFATKRLNKNYIKRYINYI